MRSIEECKARFANKAPIFPQDSFLDALNSMETADKLIEEALKQMPDKQGGTRCKIDMASQIIKHFLKRVK